MATFEGLFSASFLDARMKYRYTMFDMLIVTASHRGKMPMNENQAYTNNLRNIRGTFAAEGMRLSQSTRSNLDRIASGQASYQQVLQELRETYEKRG